MPSAHYWPLKQVRRIYEFVAGDQLGRLSLLQYLDYARVRGLNWAIEFDAHTSTVEGATLPLVEATDLLHYEALWQIGPAPTKKRPPSGGTRDSRKQRCRVAAALIWRNDPLATLGHVYRHEWVQAVACEGQPPTEKSFRDWVKDLNPNRKPGRRSTQSSPAPPSDQLL
jgi:hypothetical protein